ncbi:MAG TPA: hypothetical protein VMZ53_23080 [Kofleriaceae bacterium]|nr:hypothetical protein [Kofleriaceae bacterium]
MSSERKALAKDVAKELNAQRRKRKLATYSVFGALLAAAIFFARCGMGWGVGGGKGDGIGDGNGTSKAKGSGSAAAQAQRCTVRVSAEGIFVDGVKKTRDEAVAACKQTDGAMVTVTGDARQGDWDELRAALQAVRVKIYIRGELWDGSNTPAGSDAPNQP